MVFSVLAIGCGRTDPGGPPNAPKDASEAILQARDLIIEAGVGGIKFEKLSDVKQLESQFPKGAAAINDGSVIVVWGKFVKEGMVANPAIIAYESKAATEGGWVIREDAKIYKVTSAEFASEAPKSTPAKK